MHTKTIQKIQKAYIKTYEKDVKIYKDIENSQGTLLLQKCRPLKGASGRTPSLPLSDPPLQIPEKLNLSFLLAHVYISSYIFLHFYICLCVFAYFLCVFVYIFGFSSYKIDSLISGGRRRRPPPISLSILHEENPKIYTKTYKKYANTHKHM